MWRKALILFLTCVTSCYAAQYVRNYSTARPKYHYPVLFRHHVYRSLSEKGKEAFYATGIHPSCLAKKGVCMKRALCRGTHMLYISRVCYKRDLVCCYDNTIRNPVVALRIYTVAATTTIATTAKPNEDKHTTESTNEGTTDAVAGGTTATDNGAATAAVAGGTATTDNGAMTGTGNTAVTVLTTR